MTGLLGNTNEYLLHYNACHRFMIFASSCGLFLLLHRYEELAIKPCFVTQPFIVAAISSTPLVLFGPTKHDKNRRKGSKYNRTVFNR